MAELTNLTFDQWLKHVFDHPVTDPAWHHVMGADVWGDSTPELIVSYLTQLFENSAEVCKPYSDAHLNQGLWYISLPFCSGYMKEIEAEIISDEQRVRCIHAIFRLYEGLFAPRCTPLLSHQFGQPEDPPYSPLNMICYMWWDNLLTWGMLPEKLRDVFYPAYLNVMRQTLTLDSIACQEGALHGLAHLADDHQRYRPAYGVIHKFIATNPNISPELKDYAERAGGRGGVQ